MPNLPDFPLSPEATELLNQLMPRIHQRLSEANREPVSILLWGPGVDTKSKLGHTRANLRQKLRENGHAAFFSEELCDQNSRHSVRMQQLAQAQEFDLIVSTPCTPGSIGEIHDFAADRRVHSKILCFLNQQFLSGYSAQSLAVLETVVSCQVEYYPSEWDVESILYLTLENVQRIREMKYLLKGRY